MNKLKFCLEMRQKYPEVISIHPSVKIPEWVKLGNNVSIHEGCIIGSQGFGFERVEGKLLHIPHIGLVIIEDSVEIFEGCNICRGTIDETRIGRGTKIDALCHIGHNAKIGKDCLITAHCIVGGSVVIGDNVYLGLNTTVKDHVSIADHTMIGCGSNVVEDIVSPPESVWVGNPAKFMRMKRLNEG